MNLCPYPLELFKKSISLLFLWNFIDTPSQHSTIHPNTYKAASLNSSTFSDKCYEFDNNPCTLFQFYFCHLGWWCFPKPFDSSVWFRWILLFLTFPKVLSFWRCSPSSPASHLWLLICSRRYPLKCGCIFVSHRFFTSWCWPTMWCYSCIKQISWKFSFSHLLAGWCWTPLRLHNLAVHK